MSRRPCQGCKRSADMQVRQLRIYSRRKQFQFRLVLCNECFGGLFDLIRLSAESVSEGLWNPLPAMERR